MRDTEFDNATNALKRGHPEADIATAAIVLAGGRGSRLHDLTDAMCKPALPLPGGVCIGDFALANLRNSGVGRVMVATQYLPDQLEARLQSLWAPAFQGAGGDLTISNGPRLTGQADGFVGTADAVYKLVPQIDALNVSHVFILAADHVYHMDFAEMLETHLQAGAAATVAGTCVPVASASSFGVIKVDKTGRITGFLEKPNQVPGLPDAPAEALVSLGIYIFDWSVLRANLLRDARDVTSGHDFGYDILPRMIETEKVFAHTLNAPAKSSGPRFWRDLGSLDSYRKTQIDMTKPAFAFLAHDPAWPVHPNPSARGAQSPFSGNFIARSARVAADAVLDGCVVMDNVEVASGVRLRNAIVMARTSVPATFRAGWDATNDASRFVRSTGGTVLISPERLRAWTGQVKHV